MTKLIFNFEKLPFTIEEEVKGIGNLVTENVGDLVLLHLEKKQSIPLYIWDLETDSIINQTKKLEHLIIKSKDELKNRPWPLEDIRVLLAGVYPFSENNKGIASFSKITRFYGLKLGIAKVNLGGVKVEGYEMLRRSSIQPRIL